MKTAYFFHLPGIGQFNVEKEVATELGTATPFAPKEHLQGNTLWRIRETGDGQCRFQSGDGATSITFTPEDWFTQHGQKPEAPEPEFPG